MPRILPAARWIIGATLLVLAGCVAVMWLEHRSVDPEEWLSNIALLLEVAASALIFSGALWASRALKAWQAVVVLVAHGAGVAGTVGVAQAFAHLVPTLYSNHSGGADSLDLTLATAIGAVIPATCAAMLMSPRPTRRGWLVLVIGCIATGMLTALAAWWPPTHFKFYVFDVMAFAWSAGYGATLTWLVNSWAVRRAAYS
jgi:hypothetical protein